MTGMELVVYNNNNIQISPPLPQSQVNPSLAPPTHLTHAETPPQRRRRPRKYGPDSFISFDQMRAAAMHSQPRPYVRPHVAPRALRQPSSSCSIAQVSMPSPPSVVALTTSCPSPPMVPPTATCQQPPHNSRADNTALGVDFSTTMTTNNIIIEPGEDVFSKILSFARNTPEAISVISGIGILSNVTLHDSVDEIVTYEGQFNIQHMVGLFVPTKEGDGVMKKMKGSLQTALVDSDGQKIYGRAASSLTAASPVQVMFRCLGTIGGAASRDA